jgi:hypothetical protein
VAIHDGQYQKRRYVRYEAKKRYSTIRSLNKLSQRALCSRRIVHAGGIEKLTDRAELILLVGIPVYRNMSGI